LAASFSALHAVDRAVALLDHGSFIPLVEPRPDVSFVVGSGLLAGVRVFVALSDGHLRGGTIGLRDATTLAAMLHRLLPPAQAAQRQRRVPLIIGFDTGGVRVQEGPRALAAASAVGVALARLSVLGVPMAGVISGPRGCFGAPAVMAALPERIIMTETAHWGLTGPKILRRLAAHANAAHDGYEATAAATRLRNGDAHAVVADTPAAIRAALAEFATLAAKTRPVPSPEERLAASAAVTAELLQRLRAAEPAPPVPAPRRRRKDLLRYSFRGAWQPDGAVQWHGLLQAGLGTLAGQPALGLIIGPEPVAGAGVGIEETAACTALLQAAAARRAAILTFLFCQGHAVDTAQERFGLPRALAECLRAMVAARGCGCPIVSILGGGTYGAAYLTLAAPSHRILAMRGTSIAPMAPRVLHAFQALRGAAASADASAHLAELIPDIRIVESVIRLPRVLREELTQLIAAAGPRQQRAS
jgi:malonate decarboxylase beta subunit